MNFVLTEMTFLRYFMPLTIEGNKRNIKSHYFYSPSTKYTSPTKNLKTLEQLSVEHDFGLHEMKNIKDHEGLCFMVEGGGIDNLSSKHDRVSLTYMTDFRILYPSYIDKVDKVIMPSEYFAEYYDAKSSKNLYLGSPKYDIDLDSDEIKTKYGITSDKNVLVIFPKLRDVFPFTNEDPVLAPQFC